MSTFLLIPDMVSVIAAVFQSSVGLGVDTLPVTSEGVYIILSL